MIALVRFTASACLELDVSVFEEIFGYLVGSLSEQSQLPGSVPNRCLISVLSSCLLTVVRLGEGVVSDLCGSTLRPCRLS